MRPTRVLLAQHLGRTFARHWKIQGKVTVRDTGAVAILKEKGIGVKDAVESVKVKQRKDRFPVVGYKPEKVVFDSTHPDYHEEPCLVHGDHNVLLEGFEQAQVLTNTVEVDVGVFPSTFISKLVTTIHPKQDDLVQRIIKSSLLYDAEQKKLPKKIDPERPAWNFPREYGITDKRRNRLLTRRLLELCCRLSPELAPQRRLTEEAIFQVPLSRAGHNVLLRLTADLLALSPSRLPPLALPSETTNHELPDLFPLLSTISLEERNIYKMENIFPIVKSIAISKIQMAVVHYNQTEVSNLYETEVTESQFLGRSLMKCFTFAAAQARDIYGDEITALPEPVIVQCVHTDAEKFHFSIFQLNTLEEGGDIHNAYWSLPPMSLYSLCEYVEGRPILEGYNPDVFKWLMTFYKNS